jgi:hypothetical protein
MVLRRAAEVLGGTGRLRARLDVRAEDLAAWLAGTDRPPVAIFLNSMQIAAERLRRLHRECRTVRLASSLALKEARQARQFALGMPARIIERTLDHAMQATGAEMGNVQLLGPLGLRIVAQRGFQKPFLDFFARVDDTRSACGAAMRRRTRIAVTDVARDRLFAGTPAEPVMAAAEVRAVQSTPLLGADGRLIGVLSTHYRAPRALSLRDEESLDHAAWRAASLLGLLFRSMNPEPLGIAVG